MVNFYNFFKHLYREHPLSEQAKECMQEDPEVRTHGNPLNSSLQSLNDELSKEITVEELKSSLKKLKNGKASGLDKVTNEAMKASPTNLLEALTKLFNECLNKGIYPWNKTVISPLHKKGDINNPDNYRAIAVGSNMGKLFSSILLQRLLQYR